jgi:integrase
LQQGLGRVSPDSPVLATPEGGWLRPVLMSMRWPRAMRAIGMPGVTIHCLRHTHASTLIASGMDILSVSRRLGHGSPTITLAVYGHMIHGSDERAAAIIGQAFGSNPVAGRDKNPRFTQ